MAILELGDKAPYTMVLLQFLTTSLKIGIERGKIIPKFVE